MLPNQIDQYVLFLPFGYDIRKVRTYLFQCFTHRIFFELADILVFFIEICMTLIYLITFRTKNQKNLLSGNIF